MTLFSDGISDFFVKLIAQSLTFSSMSGSNSIALVAPVTIVLFLGIIFLNLILVVWEGHFMGFMCLIFACFYYSFCYYHVCPRNNQLQKYYC